MTPTEFAAALRKLDNPREWTNALRKEYRKVGTLAPNRAAGYADAPRNTLPWVGANWTVSTAGTGPRGVNDALAKHEPELVQEFEDAAFAFMGRAFPHGFK